MIEITEKQKKLKEINNKIDALRLTHIYLKEDINNLKKEISKLKNNNIIKTTKLKKDLKKNEDNFNLLNEKINNLIIEEQKIFETLTKKEKLLSTTHYINQEGNLCKKNETIKLEEFLNSNLYYNLSQKEKDLIEESKKYLTSDLEYVTLGCIYKTNKIEIVNITINDKKNTKNLKINLTSNNYYYINNETLESKFITGPQKGLSEKDLKKLYLLIEKAKQFKNYNRDDPNNQEYNETLDKITKLLMYANKFQKAQLPTTQSKLTGGDLYVWLVPNYLKIEDIIKDESIQNNETYLNIINSMIKYFEDFYKEPPEEINFRLDKNKKFKIINIKSEKRMQLPTTDYPDEDLISVKELSLDLEKMALYIGRESYGDNTYNITTPIPIPNEIASVLEQNNTKKR